MRIFRSVVLVAAGAYWLPQAAAMARLTPQMLKARTLQELEAAESQLSAELSSFSTSSRQLRDRRLNENEDSEPILADMYNDEPGFYHSVASGDPLSNSVIVWTRYTPVSKDETVTLELRMAAVTTTGDDSVATEDLLDPEANPALKRALVEVTVESDFIAKIDVTGLPSNTDFVFAFADESGTVSPVGQTKTAPGPEDTVESFTYAVFSCANFGNGYFHAYDVASTITDLDVWIHTGDYVYEYGVYDSYATDSQERVDQILPLWEQISLQDHRNRMATYHSDEGLQNLRRRAPLIATWDDHETTNNSYGQGSKDNTGAENHQEVCPVNSTATDEEKEDAKCDRDEGDVVTRFNNAAQAYLEWLPLRRYNGTMGVADIGSITQVISWGDMATIVAFDTRISYRSQEPTLAGATWGAFFGLAGAETDITQYTNTSSEAYDIMMQAAESVRLLQDDPSFSMIGEDIQTLETAFAESKAAGQPWQIWAAATALGRAVKGNYNDMAKFEPDANKSAIVQAFTDAVYAADASAFVRALSAQAFTNTPWNRDDFSGFGHEQRQILATMKENSNNPIVLGGDLHDSYAWQLYEDGAVSGTPCAINLVCPGVTSPGWGPFLYPIFSGLSDTVGVDGVYDLLEAADEDANPGLKYFNHQHKGFFAVKATKETHVTEYFMISPEDILRDYEAARTESGKITANFFCDAQLTTTAGQPGSLDRSDACGAIAFEESRPSLWDLDFPSPFDGTEGLVTLQGCGYDQCVSDLSAAEVPTLPPSTALSAVTLVPMWLLGAVVFWWHY